MGTPSLHVYVKIWLPVVIYLDRAHISTLGAQELSLMLQHFHNCSSYYSSCWPKNIMNILISTVLVIL